MMKSLSAQILVINLVSACIVTYSNYDQYYKSLLNGSLVYYVTLL